MTPPQIPSLPGPALLFCPADRPDRYAKALAAADAVILDLEDGVGADGKDAARAALVATDLDPARVIVRVNATGTAEHAEYFPDDQKVILKEGKPALVDSVKGETHGNELTYYANDDRLLVSGTADQPAKSRIRR